MIDSGGGRIVNIASATSAHVGRPDSVAYSTAKSGILNFTRSTAKALAEHDIRVNTLSPSRTGSPVGEDEVRTGPAASDILVRRWGRPQDQADAALYLVSDESSFVTGTELIVDGGSLA
jgi:NAD(P)-dependent dehydrogenase (short-subunit alcohol dehydrogenase family)